VAVRLDNTFKTVLMEFDGMSTEGGGLLSKQRGPSTGEVKHLKEHKRQAPKSSQEPRALK